MFLDDTFADRVWSRRQWLRAALASSAAGSLAACGGGSSGSSAPVTLGTAKAASAAVAQGLVGAAVGWLDGRGATLVQEVSARGLRSLGGAALQTSDDWYFGSNGKAMTAMVIARLVDRGLMSWTDTVATRLPTVAAQQRADYAAVTLAQWLDHRGGVLAMTDNAEDFARFSADVEADPGPLPDTLTGRRLYACAWVLRQAPQAGIRPGVDYAYSNAGYMIAAAMAEAATGRTYADLLQTELATPLSLPLNDRMPSERPAGSVQGYRGAAGQLAAEQAPPADVEAWLQVLVPAGSLATSPLGYARWLGAVLDALQGRGTVLPPSSMARLRTLAADNYALGWMGLQLSGQDLLWHLGAHQGCMALAVVARSGAWAAFAMTNVMDDWVPAVLNEQLAGLLDARGVLPRAQGAGVVAAGQHRARQE